MLSTGRTLIYVDEEKMRQNITDESLVSILRKLEEVGIDLVSEKTMTLQSGSSAPVLILNRFTDLEVEKPLVKIKNKKPYWRVKQRW